MAASKTKVKYSEEFESMILSKASELDEKGLTEGILDETILGGIMVYIDKVPALCMYKTLMKVDAPVMAGKTICAGVDSL